MFKLRYLAIASAVAATLTASAIAQAAPVLEPATQQFIDALAAQKGPPIYTLSPADARNVLAGAQAQPVETVEGAVAVNAPLAPDVMIIGNPGRRLNTFFARSMPVITGIVRSVIKMS